MAAQDILGTTECTEYAPKARAGIHFSALPGAPTVDKGPDFIIRARKAVSCRTNHHDACIGPEARPYIGIGADVGRKMPRKKEGI
jgi:hypothetical protein